MRKATRESSHSIHFPPISDPCCGVTHAVARSAPVAFIHPCRPTVAKQPPRGEGWVHELKHDGYRLQIHVRNGRVKLYTMNAADWTARYPRIVEQAGRIKGSAIIDAEVVWLDADGIALDGTF
jgi:bifunctional non-homologous end joining protein LigD